MHVCVLLLCACLWSLTPISVHWHWHWHSDHWHIDSPQWFSMSVCSPDVGKETRNAFITGSTLPFQVVLTTSSAVELQPLDLSGSNCYPCVCVCVCVWYNWQGLPQGGWWKAKKFSEWVKSYNSNIRAISAFIDTLGNDDFQGISFSSIIQCHQVSYLDNILLVWVKISLGFLGQESGLQQSQKDEPLIHPNERD